MKKKRRNDSGWRADVIAKRGGYCRACGYSVVEKLQCDHIKPRSQGGTSVVENGMMLCGPFGSDQWGSGECHRRKTEKDMLVSKEWLDEDQIAWLAEVGWVEWIDGEPHGHGCRSFAPE